MFMGTIIVYDNSNIFFIDVFPTMFYYLIILRICESIFVGVFFLETTQTLVIYLMLVRHFRLPLFMVITMADPGGAG